MLAVTARRPAVSLTNRELEIANDLGRGYTPKEIAGRRHITVWTVWAHLEHARVKLGARTNHEMVGLLARARGEDLRTT